MPNPIDERRQQHEIEIDAPIETVWKAITEAEQITCWLCEQARIEPGQGGTLWISWGEGMEGTGIIEGWEPPRVFRIKLAGEMPEKAVEGESTPGPPVMFNEYILESRGSRTVLRLVHSGIPSASSWDSYYDSTDRGWRLFLLALRHYLEKHSGKPRKTAMIMRPITGTVVDSWKKLTTGLGIGENISAPDSLEKANSMTAMPRFEAQTSFGTRIAGEVYTIQAPRSLLMNIETLDDALFTATFDEMGGTTFFYATLATFGDTAASKETRERWTAWLNEMLPTPPQSTEGE